MCTRIASRKEFLIETSCWIRGGTTGMQSTTLSYCGRQEKTFFLEATRACGCLGRRLVGYSQLTTATGAITPNMILWLEVNTNSCTMWNLHVMRSWPILFRPARLFGNSFLNRPPINGVFTLTSKVRIHDRFFLLLQSFQIRFSKLFFPF